MITDIIFFPNGMIVCCDKDGNQIAEEQTPPYYIILLDKLRRGVATMDTMVILPHSSSRESIASIWERHGWQLP